MVVDDDHDDDCFIFSKLLYWTLFYVYVIVSLLIFGAKYIKRFINFKYINYHTLTECTYTHIHMYVWTFMNIQEY